MTPSSLVVTFRVDEQSRAVIADALDGVADTVFLTEVAPEARAEVLRNAGAVLARNTARDLRPEELALLRGARLLQFMSAGVDFIPLRGLPLELPVAANGGAYAEPMAEHAVAMALAAAKRLFTEHANLSKGEFNQFTPNRMLAGGICGVLGFGGIGVATARLMRGLGMRIHAVNRRGATDEPVDWIGTPDRIDELLAASDVLVVSIPLTPSTHNLIGARELSLMKSDAILVNLARGEIVDETALYEHLKANPGFTACIDAWWIEPIRHGQFRVDRPFFHLSNVIASPHNSASVAGASNVALRRAVANCRRALIGEKPNHLVGPDDRMT
jgi:phosphoglycerate dehydrogenase-like enzyme